MMVTGADAKNFNVVRLDSFENANKGDLVSADEDTGVVVYKGRTGAAVTLTLGPHAIRILHR